MDKNMNSVSYKVFHGMSNIGKNLKIGKFCIIEDDVIIGDDVEIGNYVYLKSGTIIGNNTFIDSYVRSSGDNKIGDNCNIRYGATIARNVRICNDVFISPNVMTVFNKDKGQTVIQQKAFVGTAAVIDGGCYIAHHVQIGAMSYVNKDCLVQEGLYFGQPAKYVGVRK